jgi:hypothetical protein
MTIDELKHANDLVGKIEAAERLAQVYRDAAEVIIGTEPKQGGSGFHTIDNRLTLTAAEIGDQIVTALERRVAAMKANLQKLGVE